MLRQTEIYRGGSVALAGLLLVMLAGEADARDRLAPNDWLDRMATAVATLDYEGTVIRRKQDRAEALKVAHRVVDGVINEKVVTQEGNGLEIIRNGSEVHCILPDQKSVLIEQWNDRSTLFSTLPSSELQFGSEYDLSLVREERVAGRKAMLLAIRPHDIYRYGHRLWLDQETAFPLRTELIGNDGSVIEQLKFADIRLGSVVPDQALAPSMNLDSFTWYSQPARAEVVEVETEWQCDDLPSGFRVISTRTEQMPGVDEPVTHIVYSDGLASVSVFIASEQDPEIARQSRIGVSNTYTTVIGEHQVTAVGEVPAATVRRIADGMRRP